MPYSLRLEESIPEFAWRFPHILLVCVSSFKSPQDERMIIIHQRSSILSQPKPLALPVNHIAKRMVLSGLGMETFQPLRVSHKNGGCRQEFPKANDWLSLHIGSKWKLTNGLFLLSWNGARGKLLSGWIWSIGGLPLAANGRVFAQPGGGHRQGLMKQMHRQIWRGWRRAATAVIVPIWVRLSELDNLIGRQRSSDNRLEPKVWVLSNLHEIALHAIVTV